MKHGLDAIQLGTIALTGTIIAVRTHRGSKSMKPYQVNLADDHLR